MFLHTYLGHGFVHRFVLLSTLKITVFVSEGYMYMYNVMFVFFGSLFSGGRAFLLVLSAAGQASLPWVHYEECLDLGRAPWRRSAH